MSTEGKYIAHGGFYIKAGELKAAIERFKYVVPEESEESEDKILEHLLMYQMGNKVELRGSARDIYADCEIHASFMVNVEPIEGSINAVTQAVPYKPFSAFLKSVPDNTMLKCMQANNEKDIPHFLVESEYGCEAFYGILSRNYPPFPRLRPDDIVFMKVDAFRDMVARTLFAADDAAYSILAGVYFDFLPDKTRFVATNRYIVSIYESTELVFPKASGAKPKSMIVPAMALQAFVEGIKGLKSSDNIIIYPFEQYIMLAYGGFILSSTLLNGCYPNYERVIPKETPRVVIFDCDKLRKAIKRLMAITNRDVSRIEFTFSGDSVELYAANAQRGASNTEKVACKYSGETLKISFCAELLLPILENIKSKHILMGIDNSIRPAIIQPHPQSLLSSMLYLIMPMAEKV
jgi:DNA polymerase-3 subunit beta